jgi:hypothetical protein
LKEEAPALVGSGLREAYELLRSGRRAAGRHAYTLLLTLGMAEWLHTAAELLPAKETRRRSGPVGAGAGRTRRDELPPGVLPDLVPILAGLTLGPMKEGA